MAVEVSSDAKTGAWLDLNLPAGSSNADVREYSPLGLDSAGFAIHCRRL